MLIKESPTSTRLTIIRYFPSDNTPVADSRGKVALWLGIDKGAKWTHNGQPLSFNNYRDLPHANVDLHSILASRHWTWYISRESSEYCAFICEKYIQ